MITLDLESLYIAFHSFVKGTTGDYSHGIAAAQAKVAQEVKRLIKEYEVEGSWDLLGKNV